MGIFNWANILSPQDYGSGKGISIKNNPLSGAEVEANFIAVADYIDNASVLATDTLEKLTTLKATKEAIKKWIVPIGKRYIQYPGDALPNVFFSDLFGGDDASTWTKEWADEGITFSTEGGQALAFNGGVQDSCNKKHNHSTTVEKHRHYFSGYTDFDGTHHHSYVKNETFLAYDSGSYFACAGAVEQNTSNDGKHRHSYSDYTEYDTDSHSTAVSVSVLDSGETEARMKNRTYCIWKRTA